jgi:small subunit ribosomal protein S6
MSLRLYEELFIVKPDSTDEQVDPIVEQMTQLIQKDGGVVEKADKWGVRKLAYHVGKHAEGYYILLRFTTTGVTIKEIERRLRVNDLVIKFLTVRLDEELKWGIKRKKKREKRAARKPQVVAAPALPVAPTMPADPAAAAPGRPDAPVPAAPVPAAPAPAAPAAPAAVASDSLAPVVAAE